MIEALSSVLLVSGLFFFLAGVHLHFDWRVQCMCRPMKVQS